MTRLLVLILVVVVLWLLIEWGYRKLMGNLGLDSQTGRRAGAGSDGPGSSRTAEVLVRCDACGAYVPASRALPSPARQHACSEACRVRLRS